jgi:hypothetical protein
MPKVDNTLLEMAIVGYQSEAARVSARIADIKAQLGQPGPGRPKAPVATAAAATETATAAPAKPAEPAKAKKRKISAAGLRAIREATKKRWAAYRKAQKAAA